MKKKSPLLASLQGELFHLVLQGKDDKAQKSHPELEANYFKHK